MGFIRQTQPLAVDDGAWAVVNAAMGEGPEALFAGIEFLHKRVNACQVMAANAHIRLIRSVSTSYSLAQKLHPTVTLSIALHLKHHSHLQRRAAV